jgi:hypothetical protein
MLAFDEKKIEKKRSRRKQSLTKQETQVADCGNVVEN